MLNSLDCNELEARFTSLLVGFASFCVDRFEMCRCQSGLWLTSNCAPLEHADVGNPTKKRNTSYGLFERKDTHTEKICAPLSLPPGSAVRGSCTTCKLGCATSSSHALWSQPHESEVRNRKPNEIPRLVGHCLCRYKSRTHSMNYCEDRQPSAHLLEEIPACQSLHFLRLRFGRRCKSSHLI